MVHSQIYLSPLHMFKDTVILTRPKVYRFGLRDKQKEKKKQKKQKKKKKKRKREKKEKRKEKKE